METSIFSTDVLLIFSWVPSEVVTELNTNGNVLSIYML